MAYTSGPLLLGRRIARVHRGWQLCLERAITTSPSPGRPERALSRTWNWMRRKGEEKAPHSLGAAEARGSASLEITTGSPAQEPEVKVQWAWFQYNTGQGVGYVSCMSVLLLL